MFPVLFNAKFEKGQGSDTSPLAFLGSTGDVGGTVGNNPNRALIIGVGFGAGATPSALTWAGVSALANLIAAVTTPSGGRQMRLYGLLAPTVGDQTLSLSFTGSGGGGVVLGAMSFYNVDQTTGWRNALTNTGTSTAPTITITTAPNNMAAVGFCDNNSSTFTITSPSALDWQERDLEGNYMQAHRLAAGGTTSTIVAGTLGDSQAWGVAGVELIAAPEGKIVMCNQSIIRASRW